mgnify:CR=1 FL=1
MTYQTTPGSQRTPKGRKERCSLQPLVSDALARPQVAGRKPQADYASSSASSPFSAFEAAMIFACRCAGTSS